jgi:hypothetical protein
MSEHEPERQPAYDRWSRRDALSRRGYVLAIVGPVLVAAAGFGVVSLVASGGDTASGTTVRIPEAAYGPAAAGGGDVIEGVLRLDDEHCVFLDGGGRTTVPVWPAGYRASREGGALTIYDEDDHAVAHDGDLIRMTGTLAPAGNFTGEPCLPDSGDVAVVQSDVVVEGP